ncbi:MAG: RNA 2',3'-cyclic phosphodiesterase [Gammaproteobacteria bacterium]|nr:RNA 2',3'-cyclic phosphodiesterase [Gammaproteobacteria bacterium]
MKLSSRGQHRLFFAIDIDDSTRQSLDAWSQSINLNGRRVPSDNYHITLQFLGNISNHQVFDVIDTIEQPNFSPFHITFSNTGYYPKNEILFLDVEEGKEQISSIAKYINRSLQNLNFIKREKRNFHPHLTIAREAKPPVDFNCDAPIRMLVKFISLMESITIKSGVYYETVEQWPIFQLSEKDIMLGLKPDE